MYKIGDYDLTAREIITLQHLATGAQDVPAGLTDAQWLACLQSLYRMDLADGDFYKGQKLGVASVMSKVQEFYLQIKDMKVLIHDNPMTDLEFKILDVLRLNGREYDSNYAKKEHRPEIFDIGELTLYTKSEITTASIQMAEKGWLFIEIAKGVAHWHKLTDEGLIAFRNHFKAEEEKKAQKTCDSLSLLEDDKLEEELIPIFFGNDFRSDVTDYIKNMRRIPTNKEKVEYTASLVKQKKISEKSCRGKLWKILNAYGLYSATERNWDTQIRGIL